MKDLPRIIFVDDDKYTRLAVHQTLSLNDFDVKTFDNAMDALEELRKNTYDVLITDVKMPQMNGIELQKNVKEIDENLPVIIITGYGDVPMAVEALKNGAYDFLEKPINNEVLLASVNRAVEKRKLVLLNKNLKEEFEEAKKLRPSFQGIIGKSSQMQKIFHLIESIAKTDSTILICGETGTGKELIAKAIHNLSQRENEKFMAINIGAVPETILESELFGYEPGAFTGA
ncbi:MAG: sigma-54-dependent Fis family transcriptional regulator, partial [Nitrospira sp.]|nr:sigma-54-dependent Fis family transcriptional regulator [Nitrospira sp.]